MARVRVSVCIPAYRQPDFVRRALESVLAQTGVSFEVVITDDTPDDSVQRVVASCDASQRVRYFRNSLRLGSPENWNQAVRLAEGEYIKVLHHDDYLTGSDSLRKYVALLDEHPESDLGFSASLVWMVDSGERWVHRPTAAQLRDLAGRPQVLFAGNVIGSPSAVIFRRTVTQSFDPRLIWLVDVDYYIRVLETRRGFAFCPEPLVCTTNGSWQITTQVRDDKAVELFERLYMYNRIRDTKGLESVFLWEWARLFARHGIVSLDEIQRHASDQDVPASRLRPALWLGRLFMLRERVRRWAARRWKA
jgi:glycosyltransferase involved in cell wall biosynthesis